MDAGIRRLHWHVTSDDRAAKAMRIGIFGRNQRHRCACSARSVFPPRQSHSTMPEQLPATDGTPLSAPATSGPRIIAMLNQKGGVGKTTSTVNLGAALAEAGQRVCLIDLDPQAHLTYHLGIDPDSIERSMYDLLTDGECYASDAIINARPNLDVILSETDLAAAESELAAVENRQTILRDKFMSIAQAY